MRTRMVCRGYSHGSRQLDELAGAGVEGERVRDGRVNGDLVVIRVQRKEFIVVHTWIYWKR